MRRSPEEYSLLEQERKRVPELFKMTPMIDSLKLLKWIGIEGVFGEYPLGHIKYVPQDFIVEEISLDKSIVTVDPESAVKNIEEQGTTLYIELVKMDLVSISQWRF